MANKNEITISLEEYKELLLRDMPNNTEKMLLERIKSSLFDNIKYEKDWNGIITIDFKYDSKFTEELIAIIKIVDREFYKELIKFVCDKKAEEEANKLKMEKARAVKQIDEE